MLRKLLSNPFFVKTQNISLTFVTTLNMTCQRSQAYLGGGREGWDFYHNTMGSNN
jgi:hypothetical protein